MVLASGKVDVVSVLIVDIVVLNVINMISPFSLVVLLLVEFDVCVTLYINATICCDYAKKLQQKVEWVQSAAGLRGN